MTQFVRNCWWKVLNIWVKMTQIFRLWRRCAAQSHFSGSFIGLDNWHNMGKRVIWLGETLNTINKRECWIWKDYRGILSKVSILNRKNTLQTWMPDHSMYQSQRGLSKMDVKIGSNIKRGDSWLLRIFSVREILSTLRPTEYRR